MRFEYIWNEEKGDPVIAQGRQPAHVSLVNFSLNQSLQKPRFQCIWKANHSCSKASLPGKAQNKRWIVAI